ncbi:MAG: sulfite exporter TauE/SafE family protein, partial [Candidatus Omnitrophica bacterium]|nr:sulfite exporter TauE/SafE family protein [Candidatus Omnitrophota bacterium]
MDTANLWTWIVSGLCVILVGIAKAGFAGGIGVIATPLLSLVMSPTQAAAILLPLLCG